MNQEEKFIKDIIKRCSNDTVKLEALRGIATNIDKMDISYTAKIEFLYKSLQHFPIN